MAAHNLPHVKTVRAGGRSYLYFNTGQKADGKPIYKRLPDMSAPNFWAVYAAYNAGRTRRQTVEYTVTAMAEAYQRSDRFQARAEGTQRLYTLALLTITELLGKMHPDQVQPKHVDAILDGEPWGPAKRNTFLAVLGALYQFGRRKRLTTAHPTKDAERYKTGEHQAWPEDILEAALACEDDLIRLAVNLFYYSGQRIGDVCKMRWNDIRKGRLHIVQQKTGKALEIKIAQPLADELDATPRRGITILTQPDGKPVAPQWLRIRLSAWTLAKGVKTVPHGLRKNAVNALLEAGCTVAEVAAITGQTYRMVEYYAAQINQRGMGDAAILKLEHSANRKITGKKHG
jgi:integrase